MASYKEFDISEIVTTKTPIYESIPITGSILSGTYLEQNIKTYTHGMFQTVYDYPYQSSSANQLFDLTVGYASNSPISASAVAATNTDSSKLKINIYNQMAKVLVGTDTTGSILKFDENGTFNNSGELIYNAFFINFSRLLTKDEIKKGTFNLTLGIGTSSTAPYNATCTISDASASFEVGVNSPVGEYGYLYATSTTSGTLNSDPRCGIIFYNAGVVVLNTNIFALSSSNTVISNASSNQRGLLNFSSNPILSGSYNVSELLASGSINDVGYALRNRIKNISINNTTEVNSTIYFCRIPSSDFNYSTNPTYLSNSKITVKDVKTDIPITYFTTVGLYSANNELLAVAKVSEPIKKDPNTDITLRVRLDF